MKKIWALLLLPVCVWAQLIETFYGPVDVDEPVLLELIESPPFQRLKEIHQYGVSYYTTFREDYTRYEHSLGVFTLLRKEHLSLTEQIAGLLHDVSHTAFSHVGDWVFHKEDQEKDYQNDIHADFLRESGLEAILLRHGFTIDEVLPHAEIFPALEAPLPRLCADRIDYNIQGAYYQQFLTYEEALTLASDLHFQQGIWVSQTPDLMEKLVRFSLFMTQSCWGGPTNHFASRYLADAIMRGIDLHLLSWEDFHFGTDQTIWDKLQRAEDPLIRYKLTLLYQATFCYTLVDAPDADLIIRSKFRGIDPWILAEGKVVPLTSLRPHLAQDYAAVKKKMDKGWAIRLVRP